MAAGASSARTVGVEEEFLVVGAGDTRLRPAGGPVTRDADRASTGQFEPELKREQAELGSRPHERLGALATELRARRLELARSAAGHGSRIVAIGSAPLDARGTTTPAARYERMTDVFGATAQAALTCGMHVHVGVESRDEGVRALGAVRGWLPLVLALSANSPFVDGRDTGHESYRSVIWQQWPSGGPSGGFADAEEYDRVTAALIDTGAALDDGMVYFDARLSAGYPTIETRVADVCPYVEDAVTLAGLCRALVDAGANGRLQTPAPPYDRVELVRAATWRAARFGPTGTLVHPVHGGLVPAWALVDELADALDLPGELLDGLAAIRARGTGSAHQRAVFGRTGRLTDVVDALADLTVG